MIYKEFDSKHTFLVQHSKGYGVMESPNVEQGIVFESNDREEAEKEAKRLYEAYMTPEEKESSWIENNFELVINKNTEEGKRLYEEFCEKFKARWNENMNSQNFTVYTMGDTKIMIEHDPLFDGPINKDKK